MNDYRLPMSPVHFVLGMRLSCNLLNVHETFTQTWRPVDLTKLEIISTLLRRIGIPPPTVTPWRVSLYEDRQSNRRVGVF